jgi:D-glycero-alpha-D-manno-heptose-7-phosphate kinase
LGSGGGGFIVFYVEPPNQKKVIYALRNLMHVPFKFETDGSEVIYYNNGE